MDQNASTAASGFDTIGERKLIFHYIGKIYGDFKEYGRAIEYFEKKLALIPEKLDIEKNVPVLLEKALLQNQIGNLNFLKSNYETAERYFKTSYELTKSLKNRHGTAVNAVNLGKLQLIKLENLPNSQVSKETNSTISLLSDTSKWLEEFKDYPSPEYQAYLKNYLGIFHFSKALRETSKQDDLPIQKNDELSLLASLNNLKTEADSFKLPAKYFRGAIQSLKVAKNIAKKEQLLTALKQNLELTNSYSKSKEKNDDKTIQTEKLKFWRSLAIFLLKSDTGATRRKAKTPFRVRKILFTNSLWIFTVK